MAIVNSELGSARKSIGNVTYYRVNGKTISRRKVGEVKNPKTAKQMAQRMIFTTAVRSRDALKSIVDHSFENKAYGTASLSYFMKKALQTLRVRAAENQGAFNTQDVLSMQPNPLIISQGSLRSLNNESDGANITIPVGPTTSENNYITIGDFLSAHPEIKKGDQITFLSLIANVNVEEGRTITGEVYNPMYLIKARLIIPADIADDEVFYDKTNSEFGNLLNKEGFDNFILNHTEDGILVIADGAPQACAVIVSRPQGDKWLRSTEYLIVNENFDADMYNFTDVLNTWMSGTTPIEGLGDDEYLNQGQESAISTSYSLGSATIALTNSATAVRQNVDAAALKSVDSNGVQSMKVIVSGVTGSTLQVYTVNSAGKLVPSTATYQVPSRTTSLISLADARKISGLALELANTWRAVTNIAAKEIPWTDVDALEDWANEILRRETENPNDSVYTAGQSLSIDAISIAIDNDNNKSLGIVQDANGNAISIADEEGMPIKGVEQIYLDAWKEGDETSIMAISCSLTAADILRLWQISGIEIVIDEDEPCDVVGTVNHSEITNLEWSGDIYEWTT